MTRCVGYSHRVAQDCVECSRGHRISHLEKADVALFWGGELALRFRAVIVSVSTSEKPHASTSLFLFLPRIRYVACSLGRSEVRGEFKKSLFQPWGTSRLPPRIGRARPPYSLFFRPKSSPPQGKACCLLLKW